MITRQLPKNQWEPYFDSLSNRLHAHPPKVTVSMASRDLGDQAIAQDSPLRGLFFEEKGSEKESIDIEVGDDVSGDRLIQRVEAASVWVEETPEGAPVAIDIEGVDRDSKAKIKTIIRFER